MWGNKLGWCISAVLVLAAAGLVMWLEASARTVSPRTAISLDAQNFAPIELPLSPRSVLPGMTDPTDAGPIYRRAIREYEKDPFTYGRFSRAGQERDIEDVRAGIDILIEATNFVWADLFLSRPLQVVSLTPDKPALESLRILGACARRAGQLIEREHPEDAMKLYEAAFSLGAKLYQERLIYAELDAGLVMMAEGSALIRKLAEAKGDTARARACEQFDQERRIYVSSRLVPMQHVLSSADQATLEEHAGDVIYFARHAQDRMWRIEAIFALARYRFNAGKIGDQRAAAKVLNELAQNSDPIIATAAAGARDLTIEEYRMLR